MTRRGPWPRRLAKIAAAFGVLGLAAFTLRDRLPDPSAIGTALAIVDLRWLALAAVAQVVSMAMFARQQRRLLAAFDVRMSLRRALALSYSRSAIAISLPAGSAVSAGYAFREFRAHGADRGVATAVMILSGVVSFAGLALLYLTATLASAWHTDPSVIAAGIAAALVAVAMLARWFRPARPAPDASRPPRRGRLSAIRFAARWPRLAAPIRSIAEVAARSRAVTPRHWLLALASAATNWLTDLICLIAAAYAFGIDIPIAAIAGGYLTMQIIRQIPITPGGIGVIELSLLAALATAGATESSAAAAVLAYRLLSCWLVIPVGLAAFAVLRARQAGCAPEDGAEQNETVLIGANGLGEHRIRPRPRIAWAGESFTLVRAG